MIDVPAFSFRQWTSISHTKNFVEVMCVKMVSKVANDSDKDVSFDDVAIKNRGVFFGWITSC